MLLLLLACGAEAPDARLAALKHSIALWERGQIALQEGRVEQGLEAFDAALEQRPGDPLLLAWRAQALAAGGQVEQAVEVLDEVLIRDPTLVEARYNRAAYLARLDRPERAARDLKEALADGARPARDVLEDEDFQPYLAHEAFAFLPDATLTISTEAPQGPVFLGSEFTVMLRVFGAPDAPIAVTAENSRGPARLLRVVEDQVHSTSGPIRELSWVFLVEGQGTVELGPFQVWAGRRSTTVPELRIELLAPPGRGAPPADLPLFELRTPGEVIAGRQPPLVSVSEQVLDILTTPEDVLRATPRLPRQAGVQWQLREHGVVQWTLLRLPSSHAPTTLVVERQGKVVAALPTAEQP